MDGNLLDKTYIGALKVNIKQSHLNTGKVPFSCKQKKSGKLSFLEFENEWAYFLRFRVGAFFVQNRAEHSFCFCHTVVVFLCVQQHQTPFAVTHTLRDKSETKFFSPIFNLRANSLSILSDSPTLRAIQLTRKCRFQVKINKFVLWFSG